MINKTYKTLETPGGIGVMRKAGAHIAKVFYRLVVRQEILSGASAGKDASYGGTEIAGEVSVSQDEPMQSQVLKKMAAGDLMTLYLEDGRHLDIQATQGGSSDVFKVVSNNQEGFVPA